MCSGLVFKSLAALYSVVVQGKFSFEIAQLFKRTLFRLGWSLCWRITHCAIWLCKETFVAVRRSAVVRRYCCLYNTEVG
ncbi:hypothetical protein V8C40DRAFT_259748 [Trichoderma camerunense]